jgi:hypothetical protein
VSHRLSVQHGVAVSRSSTSPYPTSYSSPLLLWRSTDVSISPWIHADSSCSPRRSSFSSLQAEEYKYTSIYAAGMCL